MRAISKLQASFSPGADRVIVSQQSIQLVLKNSSVKDNAEARRENSGVTPTTEELSNLVTEKDQIVNNNQDSSCIDYIEPNNYGQARNHTDPIQHNK